MTNLERDIILTENSIKCCEIVLNMFDQAPELDSPRFCAICGSRCDIEEKIVCYTAELCKLKEEYRRCRCEEV